MKNTTRIGWIGTGVMGQAMAANIQAGGYPLTVYNRTKTKQNYMDLISRIKTASPDAIIYVHANLHVSHKRADKDSIVNNVQINEYNSFLQALADNESIFYLDVNPLFDAEDGYLKSEYTNDGVHPFAKHYAMWKEYLRTHVIVK